MLPAHPSPERSEGWGTRLRSQVSGARHGAHLHGREFGKLKVCGLRGSAARDEE